MTVRPLRFGLDRLLDDPRLIPRHHALGLVTNHAARPATAPHRPGREALLHAGLPIVRLFGPEHGLASDAPDGAAVEDACDVLTGLPVVSLYGARMRPTPEQLDGLDGVLFDIPDVGARFYTYTWTLWHVMGACAAAQRPVYVLDRPNPLGGDLMAVEGPLLDPVCRSFIGEDAIPVRHGLTLGELAAHWQRRYFPTLALTVVPMDGWQGRPAWPDTGCPWVQTSPAMPTFESAIWYPGLCLFEATNLSVGRGTDRPFTAIGAPWLDAERIGAELMALDLPGVRCEAEVFVPDMSPYAGEACHAIVLQVAASAETRSAAIRSVIRPVRTALHLLRLIRHHHREHYAWSPYVTAANPSGADHFARLIGSVSMARLLELDRTTDFDAAVTDRLDAPRREGWGRDAVRYPM